MTMQLFLFRELLGAIRTKSAVYFAFSGFLLFLFLASVASFFMIAPSEAALPTDDQPIEELRVFLSPRLSSETIDGWFLSWREREDIAQLQFQFAQELDNTASGGLFVVTPVDPAMASAMASEFRAIEGVTEVVEVAQSSVLEAPTVSILIRAALLAILLATITASLFCSRLGYRELLATFSGEIRMLRLTGIPERLLFTLVVALGVLVGLLGGLLLLAVLYLFHQIARSNPAAFSLFGGLTFGGRILAVGLMDVALGTVLGGLSGLLGANLLHRREFNPLP